MEGVGVGVRVGMGVGGRMCSTCDTAGLPHAGAWLRQRGHKGSVVVLFQCSVLITAQLGAHLPVEC